MGQAIFPLSKPFFFVISPAIFDPTSPSAAGPSLGIRSVVERKCSVDRGLDESEESHGAEPE